MSTITPPARPPALPLATVVAPLAPERLDAATHEAIGQFLDQGESANTRASYASAGRYWVAWWQARYGRKHLDLPVPVPVVLQFIIDHAQRLAPADEDQAPSELRHELPAEVDAALLSAGVKARRGAMSLAWLESRLSALARLHRSRELESPTDSEHVRRMMRAVKSAYARRGQVSRGKDPLVADRLRALLDTCDSSPQGVRDRALLLFAFASGGRRRSEVADADLALLRADGDGYTYNLAHSKANQTGADRPENHKPISGEAAEALRAWIKMLREIGVTEGPVFRRILKGGHISHDAGLSDGAVREIVKRRCLLAGIEGDFSAHSLRSGFMTEAGRQGVPLREVMDFSGHRDVKTALGYIRSEELKKSKAAKLI